MFKAFRLAFDGDGIEGDDKWGVRIPNLEDPGLDTHRPDIEFLHEFSGNRRLSGLPWRSLATWKLPKSSMPLLERSLAEQIAIVASYYSGNDRNQCVRRGLVQVCIAVHLALSFEHFSQGSCEM